MAPTVLPGLGDGRVGLITGGSGAIGGAVAEAMVSLGMRVGVLGRSHDRMEDVAQRLGDRTTVLPLVADIADSGAMSDAVGSTLETFGQIDVLVHAAALSEGSVELQDLTDELIDEVIRANVRGSIVVMRAVAPAMMARRRGRIVNVASVAAYQAMPGRNVYGPSKAALIQLTRQMAVELGPYGITANSVSPGQTPTHIRLVGEAPGLEPREKLVAAGEAPLARIPLRRRGTLDDYVGPVLFLASDLAAYVTGVDIPVEGGTSVLR